MFEIRRTRISDAATLSVIESSAGQAFLNLPDLAWIAGSEPNPPQLYDFSIREGYSIVATGSDDVPVGFLNANQYTDELYIGELSVRYDYQGKGIGKRLLTHAIQYATSARFGAVTLTTFSHVSWNRPFYERAGFQVIAESEMPGYLKQKRREEQQNGLCSEKRCAMKLLINR